MNEVFELIRTKLHADSLTSVVDVLAARHGKVDITLAIFWRFLGFILYLVF